MTPPHEIERIALRRVPDRRTYAGYRMEPKSLLPYTDHSGEVILLHDGKYAERTISTPATALPTDPKLLAETIRDLSRGLISPYVSIEGGRSLCDCCDYGLEPKLTVRGMVRVPAVALKEIRKLREADDG